MHVSISFVSSVFIHDHPARFLIDDIIERHIEEGMVSPELRDKISFVLLRKHRHQTKKPIHRSLADIGKGSSAPSESSPPSFKRLHSPPVCQTLRKNGSI